MITPKYKVGQKVYGRSDWFAGSFVPEKYVIRDVKVMDDKVYYLVKKRRILFDEDMLFATEEEAQIQETRRFIIIKQREMAKLMEMTQGRLLMPSDQKTIGTSKHRRGEHRYEVGQTVYGHMDGSNRTGIPETFVIRSKDVVEYKGKKYNIYYVKRHGIRPAYEDFLYPTLEEAVAADMEIFREKTKGEVRSIGTRAITLGIEDKVKGLLMGSQLRPLLEE